MSRKLKSAGKKKNGQRSMRDRYWKQVLVYAELRQWPELCDYVDTYPWLATAAMGPTILPDYLAGEKEYGLLRLLCNVEDVPVEVIRKMIALGARDREGRGYLERLLVGEGVDDSEAGLERMAAADSPLVAAEVLRTCEQPAEIINRMQQILEQGLQDTDSGRKELAERCIGRSQLFYDLLLLLNDHDAVDRLKSCLGRRKLLALAAEGGLSDFSEIEAILAEQ